MSNVIKSKDVYLNEKNIKKINPDFAFSSKLGKNIDSKNSNGVTKKNIENDESLIDSVKVKAKNIIENAESDARKASTTIYSTAKEKGYHDGMKEASSKLKELENELNLKLEKQQIEYEEFIKDFEPQVAEILISLLAKITGVIVESHQVISHLIKQALLGADKSRSYFVRVSEEDYGFVNEQKDKFREIVGEDTEIEFAIDKTLKKDQCLIETDSGIIDCSLDVQLDNLYESIRLLAGS